MRIDRGHRLEPERRPAGPAVLVLGASGFIGRHAVDALLAHGGRPVIGSRRPDRIDGRLPAGARDCPRREVHFERLLEAADWSKLLDDVDVVLNCVGILRERGRATYERIHHLAPAALAGACLERGLPLIHVSALGLDATARSGFLRSKLAGERALCASGANWFIVRPSLLDGDGGFGARWLRRVARWPVHPLPATARGLIAALDVGDLGEALARLAIRLGSGSDAPTVRELDVGGPEACTLAAHLDALRRLHMTPPALPALKLAIPGMLARVVSHVCDFLHVTPYSFGHFELLCRDNCPVRNRLPELLGRAPRAVGAAGAGTVPRAAPGAIPASGGETVTDLISAAPGFGLSSSACGSIPGTEPERRPRNRSPRASSASSPKSARIPRAC